MEQITFAPTFAGWQKAARIALHRQLAPNEMIWEELRSDAPALALFDENEEGAEQEKTRFRVPKAFMEMAPRIVCHHDSRRWALLYRVLWRLTHGEPRLLEMTIDPDVDELARMDKAVRHEIHKMRAFVRFRRVQARDGDEWFIAWFEPEHHIMEMNAPFFVDRFAGMRWSILTPERCAHWNGEELSFTAGVPKSEAPNEDAMEALWRTYYGHIFNPARVKTKAMQKEMPKRYWKNLPETTLIPALLEQAPARVNEMLARSDARELRESDYKIAKPPLTDDLSVLGEAASACRSCPLWRNATQTVFGAGPRDAEVVFLGEQPGDAEDRAGQPFVGPAGQLLDQVLTEAGIDRSRVYVTNAVKHFKWEPRGKRRIHQTPNSRDIAACRPWVEAELRVVRPRVLVCLGSTAANAVFGKSVRVLRDRGEFRTSAFAPQTLITFHPSALLRAADEATRANQYQQFLADLRLVADAMRIVTSLRQGFGLAVE
jgi:uracil-DNA glycosylase